MSAAFNQQKPTKGKTITYLEDPNMGQNFARENYIPTLHSYIHGPFFSHNHVVIT